MMAKLEDKTFTKCVDFIAFLEPASACYITSEVTEPVFLHFKWQLNT